MPPLVFWVWSIDALLAVTGWTFMVSGSTHCLFSLRMTRVTNMLPPSQAKRYEFFAGCVKAETVIFLFQCLLLAGVNLTDFHSNLVTFDQFLTAMDPILGNFREVHEFLLRDECMDIKTPLMVFTIKSQTVDEEKVWGKHSCCICKGEAKRAERTLDELMSELCAFHSCYNL